MSLSETPEFRYLLWRTVTAVLREGKTVDQAEIERRTMREYALIMQALNTPEAQDVPAEPAVVQEAVAGLRGRYPDEAAFQAELAAAGLDTTGLAQGIAAELRAGLLLEQVTAEVQISDEEVASYFEAQRERMQRPELRAARHILITVNDEYVENRRDTARERMEAVAKALKEGAPFDEMARRHSECPTAMEGGLLGRVRRGQLYPELDAALFAMAAEAISGVLESPIGFHVIRCEAIEEARPLSLEEAGPAIRRKLETQSKKRAIAQWLAARAH